MRTCTLDPMTLNDVTDLDTAPFVIEGQGDGAVKVYFESEQNRSEYLAMESHGAAGLSGLNDIFEAMAQNPDTGSIN